MFSKNAITVQLTMPVSLQFRTCLKNAIMYARCRPWPTYRRIGGGRIFVWTRLPLLIPSLISLMCGSHAPVSSSTCPAAIAPMASEPSTSPPPRPTSPLTLQPARDPFSSSSAGMPEASATANPQTQQSYSSSTPGSRRKSSARLAGELLCRGRASFPGRPRAPPPDPGQRAPSGPRGSPPLPDPDKELRLWPRELQRRLSRPVKPCARRSARS
jgi:hypothetical protein